MTFQKLEEKYRKEKNYKLPEGYSKTIRAAISDYRRDYPARYIRRRYWEYKGIKYMMGIHGHCSSEIGDMDDCYYTAGCIAMLQSHVFCEDKFLRLYVYCVCKDLGITLDRKMKRDFHKHLRRFEMYPNFYY